MLDPPEPLLFSRGNKYTIAYKCSRGIRMKGVETENDHSILRCPAEAFILGSLNLRQVSTSFESNNAASSSPLIQAPATPISISIELLQVRNHVGNFMIFFQAGKCHSRSGHQFTRCADITSKGLQVPDEA
jgi:hypothetical protein